MSPRALRNDRGRGDIASSVLPGPAELPGWAIRLGYPAGLSGWAIRLGYPAGLSGPQNIRVNGSQDDDVGCDDVIPADGHPTRAEWCDVQEG